MSETKKLTEAQAKIIAMRVGALTKDFPIKALRIVCEDGTEWKVGEFPEKKEKKRRTYPEHRKIGDLTKMIAPWVELARSSPGEQIIVRPSDFPGETMRRISGAFGAYICNKYGKGFSYTRVVPDEQEGTACILMFLKSAHPKMQVEKANGYHAEASHV